MRVKKQIALLISGAILAGSLAGCSRTIIEHQFHTDTVTDVEYIIENTGTNLVGVQNLHKYFLDHEVRMTMLCYPATEEEAMDAFPEVVAEVGIDKTPELKEASEFLTTRENMLYYITKCDKDPASWWTAYSKAANTFYDLFMQVDDEIWAENIIANHHARLVGLVCELEDEYYMLTYVYNNFSER